MNATLFEEMVKTVRSRRALKLGFAGVSTYIRYKPKEMQHLLPKQTFKCFSCSPSPQEGQGVQKWLGDVYS